MLTGIRSFHLFFCQTFFCQILNGTVQELQIVRTKAPKSKGTVETRHYARVWSARRSARQIDLESPFPFHRIRHNQRVHAIHGNRVELGTRPDGRWTVRRTLAEEKLDARHASAV
jgi:hypothetical protein